jgi:hypothetical protein
MTHPNGHRTAAKRPHPPAHAADLDAFLIDDEFDDFLDSHIAAIRESLADSRTL